MSNPQLPVLYVDESIAVVVKPARMLVHRSPIANGDKVFALQCARDQFQKHVWVVHRLDRGTSGVLVFAFSAEGASLIGKMMMAGEIDKRYAAVVRGWCDDSFHIDHPIKAVKDDYAGDCATQAKDAVTLAYCQARGIVDVATQPAFDTTRVSLMGLELLTGRRHQIRCHMKHIAHPIIGDATYGKGNVNRALANVWKADRMLLHCARMRFTHPFTHKVIDVNAPLDEDFSRVLAMMQWQDAYEKLVSRPFSAKPFSLFIDSIL